MLPRSRCSRVHGDRGFAVRAVDFLSAENRRIQPFDVALVRMLAVLEAREAAPALRRLLETSPLTSWRAGLERGPLVMALVTALGELGDEASAPQLVTILDATSQEYRPVIPLAATALGRLACEAALPVLERLVLAPLNGGMCERGSGRSARSAHPSGRPRPRRRAPRPLARPRARR